MKKSYVVYYLMYEESVGAGPNKKLLDFFQTGGSVTLGDTMFLLHPMPRQNPWDSQDLVLHVEESKVPRHVITQLCDLLNERYAINAGVTIFIKPMFAY